MSQLSDFIVLILSILGCNHFLHHNGEDLIKEMNDTKILFQDKSEIKFGSIVRSASWADFKQKFDLIYDIDSHLGKYYLCWL